MKSAQSHVRRHMPITLVLRSLRQNDKELRSRLHTEQLFRVVRTNCEIGKGVKE